MNLIELSNQLKDVPDQFLLKEVQAPSGAYPAYMVVTELTRRKRMRESAAKEMPETTVAEDLVGEQERARAMAQVQNLMAQAQPMIPSQERLNAPSMGAMGGLGALPEAQGSLAAQDAMGTTPPEMMMPVQGMAGGGMVSFREGGEIPRFQNQGLVEVTDEELENLRGISPEDYQAAKIRRELRSRYGMMTSPLGIFKPIRDQSEQSQYRQYRSGMQDVMGALPNLNLQQLQQLNQSLLADDAERAASRQKGLPLGATSTPVTPEYTTGDVSRSAVDRELRSTPVGGYDLVQAAQDQAKAAAAQPVAPAFKSSTVGELKQLLAAQKALSEPTETQRLESRAAAGREFAEQVPFRLGFMEDQMKSQAAKLRGREESNINEALIQAGLGIMGSKSPRLLGAISEGGLPALKAYQQGKKDIQQGERDLMQSRAEYAKAQMLYDQGKYAAGDKAEQRGIDAYKRGQENLSTRAAIVARIGEAEIAQSREAREVAYEPVRRQIGEATAKYYGERTGPSDADQKAADEYARYGAMAKGAPGTPAYEAEYNRLYQEALVRRSLKPGQTAPATTSPLNRGTL